jgi:UDP-sugar pyrophosphorylase
VLPPGARVGFTNFEEWTYSPVKNSVEEARAKIAVGAPGRSAAEGELEYYDAALRQLKAVGVPVPAAGKLEVFGFTLAKPARVVFSPSFAVSFNAFKARFPSPASVSISARSTLVVSGDVTIHSLHLDGALWITAAPGARVIVKRLSVTNAGWDLAPLPAGGSGAGAAEAVPDSIRIRGFTQARGERRVVEFTAAGEHVVEE